MSKRSDGAQEGADKTTREIISVLQDVEDRPFNAWELGHLDVLISRVVAKETALDAVQEGLRQAALLALEQNYHLDKSNAAVHGAEVRFSPVTFRLAESIARYLGEEGDWPVEVALVLQDVGRYGEDPGRE